MKTKLTKTGQPVMGTTIAVQLADGNWEKAKVVGKGWGKDGHTLVVIWVEWEDGVRQELPFFEDLGWLPLQSFGADGRPARIDGNGCDVH